jgi:beta-glucanase (GH16 family)
MFCGGFQRGGARAALLLFGRQFMKGRVIALHHTTTPGVAMITIVVAGLILSGLGCSKDEISALPPATPADSTALEGWTLVWNDEFGGPSVDTTRWNYEVNGDGGGNKELQYYTASPSNSFLEQGCLVIQALKEGYGGKAYTSARLNTDQKGDWLYGRVDVRAKLPTGRGLWPAIWMLPTDWVYGGWPASGEIDIMELLGQEPGKVYGTVHFGSDPQHHLSSGGSYVLPGGKSFASDFHLFSLEWRADSILWFVDRVRFHEERNGPPFDKRFHLLLNVAVGGNWPGSPDGSTVFPQHMMVDYVRVYVKNP